MGHNMTAIRKQAKDFYGRFNKLLDEKEKLSGEIMSDVKALYEEGANEIGCSRKILRIVLTEARAEMKKEARDKEFDQVEQESLETLRDALGLLGDLPLGQAALKKAEAAEEKTGESDFAEGP